MQECVVRTFNFYSMIKRAEIFIRYVHIGCLPPLSLLFHKGKRTAPPFALLYNSDQVLARRFYDLILRPSRHVYVLMFLAFTKGVIRATTPFSFIFHSVLALNIYLS